MSIRKYISYDWLLPYLANIFVYLDNMDWNGDKPASTDVAPAAYKKAKRNTCYNDRSKTSLHHHHHNHPWQISNLDDIVILH